MVFLMSHVFRNNKCTLLLLGLSAAVFLSIMAVGYVEKLRPVRVFSQYCLCRLAALTTLFDVDCRTLPTITIQPPSKPNGHQSHAQNPRELQLFFDTYSLPEHVYAHGTNSPEHVRVYKDYYRAFEFDAFWDEERHLVDIFHWPNHVSIDFHLRDFLTIIPEGTSLWMDLKNLSNENLSEFRLYMDTIFQEYPGLNKNNIIIESKMAQPVSRLNQHGYQTAYYLPAITYNGDCHSIHLTEHIVTNIKIFPTSYISFPYWQQRYVDDCLLPHTGPLKQISWGGVPYAIPKDALARYHAYIVDHDLHLPPHDI